MPSFNSPPATCFLAVAFLLDDSLTELDFASFEDESLMNEFFRTKNDRNLMRGHISRYGNVLWTVPARIFLGAMWLVDCWDKVQGEGSWFTNKLRLPFDWLQPAVTSGASKAADATSAASGAAAGGAAEPATAKVTFCLSGMFYWVNIWIIPMALACMNDSGRAFGLDKWVVPYLQKHLGHWRYGQQRALYKNQ